MNLRTEEHPVERPPIRLVEWATANSAGDNHGVRIERGHPDNRGGWSVTFGTLYNNRYRFGPSRWTDVDRSDIIALRDALTQLLNDNP